MISFYQVSIPISPDNFSKWSSKNIDFNGLNITYSRSPQLRKIASMISPSRSTKFFPKESQNLISLKII